MEHEHGALPRREPLDKLHKAPVAGHRLGPMEQWEPLAEPLPAPMPVVATVGRDAFQPRLERGWILELADALAGDDVDVLGDVVRLIGADQRRAQADEARPGCRKLAVELVDRGRRCQDPTLRDGRDRFHHHRTDVWRSRSVAAVQPPSDQGS